MDMCVYGYVCIWIWVYMDVGKGAKGTYGASSPNPHSRYHNVSQRRRRFLQMYSAIISYLREIMMTSINDSRLYHHTISVKIIYYTIYREMSDISGNE